MGGGSGERKHEMDAEADEGGGSGRVEGKWCQKED